MMRLIFALLLLSVPVLGVYTWVISPEHGWWFPQNVSSYGGAIDRLFWLILWMVTITFVATEVLLFWFVWRYSKRDATKGVFTHGNHRLEMVWTAVPAMLLLFIAFAQMGTWADIKFGSHFPDDPSQGYTRDKPIAEVIGSQFDWRVRYPGGDGQFGTLDDVENPFEFVVPVNENIVFDLRSRDVIHSFFVPEFRLKQDALPGHTIPVWFKAEKEGSYDLICAELCGWGHYKMAGRVRVVPRAEYEQWLADLTANWFSNGTEEQQ
jgi:cytochrome c oxidase subunit 2